MSRTPQDRTTPPAPEEFGAADDVEILEVLGVDENGGPLPDGNPDDVEVVFDETK